MTAQYWVLGLTVSGFFFASFGLVEGFATVRRDYLHTLRQEARMRYLNRQVSLEYERHRLHDYESKQIWAQWATERRARMWKLWKLPIVRNSDLNVAPVIAGRLALAQTLRSVTGDLIWVGLGLLLATAAGMVSAFASLAT